MATEQEQCELMTTLRFVPRTYTIEVSGRGGEIVIGTISQPVYDYWESNEKITLDDFIGDWDGELDIPEEMKFLVPNEWHECDDIAHEWGASMPDSDVQVCDENGDNVWTHDLTIENLITTGIIHEQDTNICVDDLDAGTCVFVGESVENGTFFLGEIYLTVPFNPANLKFNYSTINGWPILSNISYNDEEIDTDGGSTYGKGIEFNIYRVEASK